MYRTRLLPLLIAALAVAAAPAPAQTDCDAVLRYGVWEDHTISNTAEGSSSFEDFFIQSVRNGRMRTTSTGFSYADQKIDLGFSNAGARAQEAANNINRGTSITSQTSETVRESHRVASAVLVGAWLACKQSRQGVYFTAEQRDPGLYVLRASKQGGGPVATVEAMLVPAGVRCNTSLSQRQLGGSEIGPVCENRTRTKQIVQISTSGWGDHSVELLPRLSSVAASECRSEATLSPGVGTPAVAPAGCATIQAQFTLSNVEWRGGHQRGENFATLRVAYGSRVHWLWNLKQESHCDIRLNGQWYDLGYAATTPDGPPGTAPRTVNPVSVQLVLTPGRRTAPCALHNSPPSAPAETPGS